MIINMAQTRNDWPAMVHPRWDTQMKTANTVAMLRGIATRALGRMYLPDKQLFAFRVRMSDTGTVAEGVSHRYTAAALIALAGEDRQVVREALAGHRLGEVYDRLVRNIDVAEDLGEVALTLWAGRALAHDGAGKALHRLMELRPGQRAYSSVELAWALTALSVEADSPTDLELAARIAGRLIGSQNPDSCLFPHWPADAGRHWLRGHVACFADLVYPIQALARFAQASAITYALDAARSCAQQMCRLQGPDGQWWWHYDVRTGKVVERYPVYSVHQDSMAVLALRAVGDACGYTNEYAQAIDRSLAWLMRSPEIDGSLIDSAENLIWRKVARCEPRKLSRDIQAASSRLHPSLRMPLIDRAFPPHQIDYECRPYHMGWILYAWPESLRDFRQRDQGRVSAGQAPSKLTNI